MAEALITRSNSHRSYSTTTHDQLLSISPQLSQQILLTHNDNSTFQTLQQLELKHLVKLIQSIFQNAAAAGATTSNINEGVEQSDNLNGLIESFQNSSVMRQVLSDICSVSCEISCNMSAAGNNVHGTTMEVLLRLKNYSWNAKVVLAMAAFASSIGELLVLLKHRNTDPIAKSVDILKLCRHSTTTTALDLTRLQGLFKAMEDVVNTNLAFMDASISNIRRDSASMREATSSFPAATYKILGIVLQTASILSKSVAMYLGELERLKDEVSSINIFLEQKLTLCRSEAALAVTPARPYQYHEVPEVRIGISEVIEKIMHYMRTQAPEQMRNKHALFLIADLDISIKEIKALYSLYQRNGQKYEIVWLPIVDLSASDYNKDRFLELKQMMKWTVVEPSIIESQVIGFIKKEWRFIKNPIAVSVTPGGQLTSQNALTMLWTWGNEAFPFTYEKEQALWKDKVDDQNGWTLNLLLDDLVQVQDLRSWTESLTFVCLFGGGDLSWIQRFIEKVRNATREAGVTLKLVYVGNRKGQTLATLSELSEDIHVIESESQWRFWSRLESILYAKIRYGKAMTAYKTDRVMQEALKAVGYGGRGEAWATFSMGSGAMVTTKGDTALTIMSSYENWRRDKAGVYFLDALRRYKEIISMDVHDCINIPLPVTGEIPGMMICPECSKVMEMFYTYRCCPEPLVYISK
ncbi:hypothetical protein PTKIN_Ptkin01aG0287500 [Pterospermum kingtungense]